MCNILASNRHASVDPGREILSRLGQDGLNLGTIGDTSCSVIGCFEKRAACCHSCDYSFCTDHIIMGHDRHITYALKKSHQKSFTGAASRPASARSVCECGADILAANMSKHVLSKEHTKRLDRKRVAALQGDASAATTAIVVADATVPLVLLQSSVDQPPESYSGAVSSATTSSGSRRVVRSKQKLNPDNNEHSGVTPPLSIDRDEEEWYNKRAEAARLLQAQLAEDGEAYYNRLRAYVAAQNAERNTLPSLSVEGMIDQDNDRPRQFTSVNLVVPTVMVNSKKRGRSVNIAEDAVSNSVATNVPLVLLQSSVDELPPMNTGSDVLFDQAVAKCIEDPAAAKLVNRLRGIMFNGSSNNSNRQDVLRRELVSWAGSKKCVVRALTALGVDCTRFSDLGSKMNSDTFDALCEYAGAALSDIDLVKL